jgi:thiol:disulfide interchange protein
MLPRLILWFLSLLTLVASAGVTSAQDSDRVRVRAQADRQGVRPGDQFVIAVVFDHEPGWHIHTNEPNIPPSWRGFVAIPTVINARPSAGAITGPVQWPKPHEILVDLAGTGKPEPYAVFEGRAVAYVPVQVDANAKGTISVALNVSFQACDDRTCLPPDEVDLLVTQKVLAADETPRPTEDPALFAGFDISALAAQAPKSQRQTSLTFREFGWNQSIDTSGWGLGVLLALAVLGGMTLNLTPCVLPVIPLKIMGLSQSAAGNPRRTFFLGVVMALGVIAFWLLIGALIAAITAFKAINQLFQLPAFTLSVGVFILAMGAGMLGLFSIRLPQAVYFIDPRAESVPGSFLFGIMTAVLSTPCTAPFMGTASAWAAYQRAPITLVVFAAIGLGMALPYLLLAANPKWLSKIPRSGPGSDLVKKVMGLFMIAVSIFFLGTGLDPMLREPVDPPMRWHWWLILAFAGGGFAWLMIGTFRYSRSAPLRATIATLCALVFAGLFLFVRSVTDRGPIDWKGYTAERFESARQAGKVVVLDFTAEWCLNCKALENTVLHTPRVADALNADDVVALRVDLTGRNEPGKAKLRELRWVGIPLLAVFGPGLDEPIKYDWYTPEMVLDAIARARGTRPE